MGVTTGVRSGVVLGDGTGMGPLVAVAIVDTVVGAVRAGVAHW